MVGEGGCQQDIYGCLQSCRRDPRPGRTTPFEASMGLRHRRSQPAGKPGTGMVQHDWPGPLCGAQGYACGRLPTCPDIVKPARNKRFSQLVFGWRRRQPNRPLGGTTGSWPSLWTLLLSGVPGGAQRIRPAAQPRQAGMGRWALPSISPSSSDLVILLMPTRAVDLGVEGMDPQSLVDLHSPASNSSGCSAQPLSPVLPLSPFPGHLFFFCKILGRCAGWLGPSPTVLVPDK